MFPGNRTVRPRRLGTGHLGDQSGFTLVEMLVAVAITLVMMAAVVTLFANITNSVRNRRATIEMSGQLRHVRNMLQQDLQAATCPGQTWQRPESNRGYIEIIEGLYRDAFPSALTDGMPDTYGDGDTDYDNDGLPDNDELDAKMSFVPRNNNIADLNGNNQIDDDEIAAHLQSQASLNTVNGLGDYDDVLMFTARNEHEPYVGRVPEMRMSDTTHDSVRPDDTSANPFGLWESESIKSPLAEIIWYAMENPTTAEQADGFFGEPGMRTIYRRALLIAPWVNPYRYVSGGTVVDTFQIGGAGPVFTARPGLVRVMNSGVAADQAMAALIAFQERFDLSVRLEFDRLLDPANGGRWKIVANTLADLTKRENRYGHHQFAGGGGGRHYPYAIISAGTYGNDNEPVQFQRDPELPIVMGLASANANLIADPLGQFHVASYFVDPDSYGTGGTQYQERPFAYLNAATTVAATANVMLNDEGKVVRVVQGPVPLSGRRRGEDVMLSNVLGFDLRVYDPGAPIYQDTNTQTVLEPGDPGWTAYYAPALGTANGSAANPATFVGQGAYVDLGYAFGAGMLPYVPPGTSWVAPSFADARALSHVTGVQLAPGYSVYDTFSFSYENNGVDEDDDGLIDEGTNGLDDFGVYGGVVGPQPILGPDDVGERETAPPYDKPLRGVQVILRVYEGDSRQIRQVRVNQHFMAE